VDDLHIQKAGVVHQNQARLIFIQKLHPFRFIGESCTCHTEPGQALNQVPPEEIALFRHSVFGAGQGQCFFVGDIFYADLQISAHPSFYIMIMMQLKYGFIIPKNRCFVKDWTHLPGGGDFIHLFVYFMHIYSSFSATEIPLSAVAGHPPKSLCIFAYGIIRFLVTIVL
jgi:hypothetical protein